MYSESGPEAFGALTGALIGRCCLNAYHTGQLTGLQAAAAGGSAAIMGGIASGYIYDTCNNNDE